MNKSTSFTIITSLTLILGLAGAIALVRNSQDNRSSASFSNGKMVLTPDVTVAANENFKVHVKVQNLTQVMNAFQVVVCYDPLKAELDKTNILMPSTDVIKDKSADVTASGKTCFGVAGHKEAGMTGADVELFALTFKALGSGTVEILGEKTKVAGVNPAGGDDNVIAMDSYTPMTFTVGAVTTECTEQNWTSTLTPATCPETGKQTKTYTKTGTCTGGVTHPATEEVTCTPNTVTCTEQNWTSTLSPAICPATGKQTKTYTKVGTCTGGITHNATEEITCTYISTTDKKVNVKLSFLNVLPDNSECSESIPLAVIALVDGKQTAIEGVVATKTSAVNKKGFVVYEAQIPMKGVILPSNNVALFVKGPKHLQMKFGVDNQSSTFGEAGGRLSLDASPTEVTNFNFSEMPILSGDMVGMENRNGNNQDGIINAVDFSYVKGEANMRNQVDPGQYLKADLDGSCQVNSRDVTTLLNSLQEKQAQLY